MSIELQVNGSKYNLDVEPDTPLLWVLRDELGLLGTKFGCGIGACGCCSVHIDGALARSCTVPVESVQKSDVVTIEGLAARAGLTPGELHPVQRAWIEMQVPLCGYCQPGMIMAVAALIARTPTPSDSDVAKEITNLCRCGSYPRVRHAIAELSKQAQSVTR
jgi:isoquinoline 1-oxidoreductase subunit alpha